MRFDVPAVGLNTLEAMLDVGAKVLAVEAGKTIILDHDLFLKKVNQEKLIFVGKRD